MKWTTIALLARHSLIFLFLELLLLLFAPGTTWAAAPGTCLSDEFDGSTLDLTKWDVFKGHPTVSAGQLILTAEPGTRADIQSKTVCQYGILHAVITSSNWKSQTSTTDASFGFEFFDGNCHYGVILVANGILGFLRSEPDSNNDCSTQSVGIPGRLPSDPKFQESIPSSIILHICTVVKTRLQ